LAKLRKKALQRSLQSTKVAIPNLLSVGKQPPNKRQSYEAEVLTNVIISLEKNFEKRSGFSIVNQFNDNTAVVNGEITPSTQGYNNSDDFQRPELYFLSSNGDNETPDEKDYWYYWYNINEDNRYLITIDPSAVNEGEPLFFIVLIRKDGSWEDKTSKTQWDKTVALNNSYVVDYASDNNISVQDAADLGTLSTVSRSYLTFNPDNNKSSTFLKASALGSTLIILNKNVYAGFSSDKEGYTFGLDGEVTGTVDVAGKRLTYWSSSAVSKKYGLGPDGTAGSPPGSGDDTFIGYVNDVSGDLIPVQDFIYFDSTYPYLGQSVNDASIIQLPPQIGNWIASNGNGGDFDAREMLKLLYDSNHPHKNYVAGRGKIFYAKNSFLNLNEGYYRILSFQENQTTTQSGSTFYGKGRPYLQKIRTPIEHSYIDPKRMPQRLSFNLSNPDNICEVEPINWTPRTSGDNITNPGPSLFKNFDGTVLKQSKINTVSVFKDRLFFAGADIVFSSQLGAYESLFIENPTNITEKDPIDVRASSNTFAEITSMTPFEEYLFIDSKANMQFILQSGSTSSVISPLSVAIDPITFYSTAPIVEPVLVGSQLFFLDKERIYLYTGKDRAGLAKAVELSLSVTGYLPSKFRTITTAPAQDSIIMVGEDTPNKLFLYTIRFSGERLIQSSFYDYDIQTETTGGCSIEAVQVYNDHLYIICKVRQYANNAFENKRFVMRCLLRSEDTFENNVITVTPRLDFRYALSPNPDWDTEDGPNYSCAFDAETNITTFRIPNSIPVNYSNLKIYTPIGYLNTESVDKGGLVITPLTCTSEQGQEGYYLITALGNLENTVFEGNPSNEIIYFGITYEMNVQLSPVFYRDLDNKILQGSFNLRTGIASHAYSGQYTIEASTRGRDPLVSVFNPDTFYQDLPLLGISSFGTVNFRVFGFSTLTSISFKSNNISPVNITNIELKGKFNKKYSLISS